MTSPPNYASENFFKTLDSFRALKDSLEQVLAKQPSDAVATIQLQLTAFEKDYLLWNPAICGDVKKDIDAIFFKFFSDASLVSLTNSFSNLVKLLDRHADLVNILFEGYLYDRVNYLIFHATKQLVRFWVDDWDPKTRITYHYHKTLQEMFDYNCHIVEYTCTSPKLAVWLTSNTMKMLLEGLLPYLVIFNTISLTPAFCNNLPINLSCMQSPFNACIRRGLNCLPVDSLTVALLQLLKDFLVRTKLGPVPEAGFLIDMRRFGFIFTTFGYQFKVYEVEQVYLGAFETMFDEFIAAWERMNRDLEKVDWSEIFYELYAIMEILAVLPKQEKHVPISRLIYAFAAQVLKRVAPSGQREQVWAHFGRIDQEVGVQARTRLSTRLYQYFESQLNRQEEKRRSAARPTDARETTPQNNVSASRLNTWTTPRRVLETVQEVDEQSSTSFVPTMMFHRKSKPTVKNDEHNNFVKTEPEPKPTNEEIDPKKEAKELKQAIGEDELEISIAALAAQIEEAQQQLHKTTTDA